MSIEYWTLIVEVIGSLGVMVTLLYLAIQMRQNTKQTFAENTEAAVTKYIDAAMELMRNEDDADFLRRALHDYNGLSPTQKTRFYAWAVNLLRGFEAIAIKHRSGLIDSEYFVAVQKLLASWIACPGLAELWSEAKEFVPERTVEEIEFALRTYEVKPVTESWSFLQLTPSS